LPKFVWSAASPTFWHPIIIPTLMAVFAASADRLIHHFHMDFRWFPVFNSPLRMVSFGLVSMAVFQDFPEN